MRRGWIRPMEIVAVSVLVFVATLFIGVNCYASSKYNGDYAKCIRTITDGIFDEMIEEEHGMTSKEYMCRNAAADKNTCTLWIGSMLSATIPTITVYGETGEVNVMYWGTCTDYEDTTAWVKVEDDGEAINDSSNVKRLGYPNFGHQRASLDVAKFINGAEKEEINECETAYTRTIKVGRKHSNTGSTSYIIQKLTVRVISEDCSEGNTCDDWIPASYTNSKNSDNLYGATSIDIRIKNMAGRFGGTGFGAWNDFDIWAMPTDTIAWIACYYPGVQYTYNTNISSLRGWIGYDNSPLPTNTCISKRSVEYRKLHAEYVNQGNVWENKYKMSGDAGTYNWSGEGGDTEIQQHIIYLDTVEGDAGSTFTESAETGKPVEAKITKRDPIADFEGCWAKGTVAEWEEKHDAYGLIVYDENGLPVKDPVKWYYDSGPVSCCDQSGVSSTYGSTEAKNDNYTGHKNMYEKSIYDATVNDGPVSDRLSVRLPYNFKNSTDVEIEYKPVFFSGHERQMHITKVTVTVGTRENELTKATYATQVPSATIRLFVYVTKYSDGGISKGPGSGDACSETDPNSSEDHKPIAKQCLKVEEKSGELLNGRGLLGGKVDEIWTDKVYNAFDASAGDYMCAVSAMSPEESQGDDDMIGGDGAWVYSKPQCVVIAKKPTFQVWGSGLYSKASINASYNSKVNIYKSYKDNVETKWKRNGGTPIHFYPWVEENLIIYEGLTDAVTSGAAGGLNNRLRDDAPDGTNPAGVGTADPFCKNASALSFANYSTEIGDVCNIWEGVGNSYIDGGIKDREALIKYLVGVDAEDSRGNVSNGATLDLSTYVGDRIASATGAKIQYINFKGNGNIKIKGSVPYGTTYLIKSDDTVTITGDIKYKSDYTEFWQIPKVVIYAKNVNIESDVGEVDAIIVTGKGAVGGGVLDTCSNNCGSDSDSKRSKQLKIFGMVVTDKINLGRSYGSAANEDGTKNKDGVPSDGVAAEIFDYDSSILMWSEFMAGSNESDTLQTVYQHEIAPRY